MMRDNPRFGSNEVNEIARKAFIQVDNPHKSQWTDADQSKYGYLPKPHWLALAKTSNTYQSKRVLGELFDMFDRAGEKDFNFRDIEAEMNVHIRERIEKAYKKDREEVEVIRKDTRRHKSEVATGRMKLRHV